MDDNIVDLTHVNDDLSRDSSIDKFFFYGNKVNDKPDYGIAEAFIRTAEALANTTVTLR